MSRRETLNMLAVYAALVALGYALATHTITPAAVASVSLGVLSYVQERNPE